MRATSSLYRFASIFIWCSILTSSFDIVLNVEIAGLNFRATQLFMLIAMACYLINCLIERDVVFQRMHLPLLFCFILNTLFMFNAKLMSVAFGYELWLAFDVFQILVVTRFLSYTETLSSLLKKYIYCFTAVAVIGILQQGLMLVGVDFFVTQENRVNGFSFEPSFYSTYLLMGWVMCMYLLEQGQNDAMPMKNLVVCFALITLANLCSTSRMGMLFMALYAGWRIIWLLISGNFKSNKIKKCLVIGGTLLIVGVVSYLIIGVVTENPTVLYFFRGLGIGGTGNWSSGTRLRSFSQTFEVFLNQPVFGTSLGGTDAAVAELIGAEMTSEDTGSFSICVLLEVFVAWGALGGILFLVWLFRMSFAEFRSVSNNLNKGQKDLLRCVIYAMLFEILILCLNQNILRPPLWGHFAVLSAMYQISYSSTRLTGKVFKQL